MRKIESEMQAAIAERRNWSKYNTCVSVDSDNNTTVTLHGNTIATIFNNGDMRLSSCGWQTVTTKSRLNAILDVFFHRLGIWQKDFVWYIGHWDSDNSGCRCAEEFFDGYSIVR